MYHFERILFSLIFLSFLQANIFVDTEETREIQKIIKCRPIKTLLYINNLMT